MTLAQQIKNFFAPMATVDPAPAPVEPTAPVEPVAPEPAPAPEPAEPAVSPEEVENLRTQLNAAQTELAALRADQTAAQTALNEIKANAAAADKRVAAGVQSALVSLNIPADNLPTATADAPQSKENLRAQLNTLQKTDPVAAAKFYAEHGAKIFN
jgi:hypothetical protein